MKERIRIALDRIEDHRRELRVSIRRAADRAGMSEATWRQLAAGHVRQAGQKVERLARRDQVLDMAAAVELLDEVGAEICATEDELEGARRRVRILDPAEEEIMASRHLSSSEKLYLLETLRQSRDQSDPAGTTDRVT